MHHAMQALLTWYFDILHSLGLLGVVMLMAMERSVFPVPSELVVPPAAYLACQGKQFPYLHLLQVIAAGTFGSWLGAAGTYWVARAVGRPLIVKYGKYIMIPEAKLVLADRWMVRYGAMGIFIAALLPVVRHLISIPAAVIGMRFRTFSLMTLCGSALWCTALAVFGMAMSHDMAAVISQQADSTEYRRAFANLFWGATGLATVVLVLYFAVVRRKAGSPDETLSDSVLL